MLSRQRAYTLMELSMVLVVLSLLSAAAMRYSTNATVSKNNKQLTATMDAVETALQSYAVTYSRLPCPSDTTVSDNSAAFGVEVGTSGDGNCTGYNFINSTADADDGTTTSQVVAGAIPTKTLKIDDRYAYDPWGRRILYVVDKRITATSAFTTYPVSNSTVGVIVVKKSAADSFANAISARGLYALLSFGPNGHGGYVRNPGNTSTRYNDGSTNTDEQKNCHCTSAAVAGTFDRNFVQKTRAMSTTLTNMFDDILRYKSRAQMTKYSDLQ